MHDRLGLGHGARHGAWTLGARRRQRLRVRHVLGGGEIEICRLELAICRLERNLRGGRGLLERVPFLVSAESRCS